jgi:hypothetical protein
MRFPSIFSLDRQNITGPRLEFGESGREPRQVVELMVAASMTPL